MRRFPGRDRGALCLSSPQSLRNKAPGVRIRRYEDDGVGVYNPRSTLPTSRPHKARGQRFDFVSASATWIGTRPRFLFFALTVNSIPVECFNSWTLDILVIYYPYIWAIQQKNKIVTHLFSIVKVLNTEGIPFRFIQGRG